MPVTSHWADTLQRESPDSLCAPWYLRCGPAFGEQTRSPRRSVREEAESQPFQSLRGDGLQLYLTGCPGWVLRLEILETVVIVLVAYSLETCSRPLGPFMFFPAPSTRTLGAPRPLPPGTWASTHGLPPAAQLQRRPSPRAQSPPLSGGGPHRPGGAWGTWDCGGWSLHWGLRPQGLRTSGRVGSSWPGAPQGFTSLRLAALRPLFF
jgi:hypothetical protein